MLWEAGLDGSHVSQVVKNMPRVSQLLPGATLKAPMKGEICRVPSLGVPGPGFQGLWKALVLESARPEFEF